MSETESRFLEHANRSGQFRGSQEIFEGPSVKLEKDSESFRDGREIVRSAARTADHAEFQAGVEMRASAASKPGGLFGRGKEKAKIFGIVMAGVVVALAVLSLVVPGLREFVWGWLAAKNLWIVPASFAIAIVLSLIFILWLPYWWDKTSNDPNQIKKIKKRQARQKRT